MSAKKSISNSKNGSIKKAKPRKAQLIYEKVLGYGVWFLVLFHMLLSTGRYFFDYFNTVRPYECWYTLILIIAGVLYLLLTLIFWRDTLYRIKIFFKKLISPAQIFCFALFVWYIITCWANTKIDGRHWFYYNDWWLLDAFILCVILFSMPRVLSEKTGKKMIDCLLYIISAVGTVTGIWALWNLFQLKIITLPSGSQIGMDINHRFFLGCSNNITGAIALCFILISFYMIAAQKRWLRIIYVLTLIPHTLILLLTNSRTSFVTCMAAYAIFLFLLLWNTLHQKPITFRLLCSIAISVGAVGLLWLARPRAFLLFESVTHFSEILAAQQNRSALPQNPAAFVSGFAPTCMFFILPPLLAKEDRKKTAKNAVLILMIMALLLCFQTLGQITQISDHMVLQAQSDEASDQQKDTGEQYLRTLDSAMNRDFVWKAAIKVIKSSPQAFFFGKTPFGTPDALYQIGGAPQNTAHAHNEILQMGVSMGVPMMILFVIFLVYIGIKSLRLGLVEGGNHFSGAYILPIVFATLFILTLTEAYLFGYFSIMGCLFFLFTGWINALTSKNFSPEAISVDEDEEIEEKMPVNINSEKAMEIPTEIKEKSLISVWILFPAAFLIHLILNILVKKTATVVIDEGLYTNIARSLAWDGEIAFRAQPINYQYLLYPMLLVPLYRLQRLLGGDIFRWIQVFNTLLICSSVIPAYLFARDFTKDRGKASAAALAVAMMPDMIMGGYTMTEALLWPLSLWMVYFTHRYFQNDQIRDGLLAALFTGLMFATKPGAIAVGAVMLIFAFILKVREDRSLLRIAIIPPAFLLLIIIAVFGIYLILSPAGTSIIGLYQKQTSTWTTKTILVALEASFLQIFLFIFACGGIFGILPLLHRHEYPGKERAFVTAFLSGVLAALLGVAIFVVPYKWDDSLGQLPLHMRYTSMYIPVMLVFSLAIPAESKLFSKRFAIVLGAFILLAIFPGARVGFVNSRTGEIDSMTLAAFMNIGHLNGNVTGWILTGLMVLFLSWVLFYGLKKGWTRQLQTQCLIYFGVFLLFNSVCAHIAGYSDIDSTILSDAREINEWVGADECLGITQRYYSDFYSYWLDSRLNQPMQQVTIDQMYVTMREMDGIYSPFVPLDQPPNVNNHETPDTNIFVLGKTIGEHLELNESVTARKTKNGHFTYAEITPGERWIDSMMYGLDDNTLRSGQTAYITIFDENRGNDDGTMTLLLTASGKGSLIVDGYTIELSENAQTYNINMPYSNPITLQADGASVEILSYYTKIPDT